jgi:hypothetical protein
MNVFHRDRGCRLLSAPGRSESALSSQAKAARVKLLASVGRGGVNGPADVRKVQGALNKISAIEGGSTEQPLAVDGLRGSLTQAAIDHFQETQFGKNHKFCDGRIDALGPTIHRMNELIQARTVDPFRIPILVSFVTQATQAVLAAQANITMARPFVGILPNAQGSIPSLGRSARLRLVNRHFDLDKHPKPGAVLNDIEALFRLMQTILTGKPFPNSDDPFGQNGNSFFVLDPIPDIMDSQATAYTEYGGFHTPNTTDTWLGLRNDRIYVCTGYSSQSSEFKLRVILHELAHFVGNPNPSAGIGDYGYGIVTDPKMRKLVPSQKTHNADSYANFAMEALFGRDLTEW